MAVICKNQHGCVIDHNMAIKAVYTDSLVSCEAELSTEQGHNFCLNKDLFAIHEQFLMDSQFEALKAHEREKHKTETDSETDNVCETIVERERQAVAITKSEQGSSESEIHSKCEDKKVPNVKLNEDDKTKRRKRKRKCPLNQGELDAIAYHDRIKDRLNEAFTSLTETARHCGYFSGNKEKVQPLSDNNSNAREAANILGPGDKLKEMCHQRKPTDTLVSEDNTLVSEDITSVIEEKIKVHQIHAGEQVKNVTDIVNTLARYQGTHPGVTVIFNERYLLPPKSSFFLSDFTNIDRILSEKDYKPYDVILLDPPWLNKSVKRKKKYWSLTDEDLLKLPIPSLLAESGIIVVWVTNKLHHINFIIDTMFKAWNVQYITEWHWIKVTTSGEMVYDFNSHHKKPYEVLIFGQRMHTTDDSTTEYRPVVIPKDKVIISVPSSIHSMKPPLNDVLKEFIPVDANCLELFARNLWPGWTSWGNEVLKHQHLDFYEECKP